LLRRTLLILVTGLIVARPIVLGEDPGLLADLSDPGHTALTLLWLVAGAGWAVWRLLASRAEKGKTKGREAEAFGVGRAGSVSDRSGGGPGAAVVEAALAATVVVVFVSALAARYRHPARLIAWEWVGLFAAFFAVRRLAARPAEQQGLLAALLAAGVALAAHGVYQRAVEMPRMQREYPNRTALRAALERRNDPRASDPSYVEALYRRAQEEHVYGAYAHPNSFAGFLALVLPGLAGAAVVYRRARAPAWRTVLTAGCALLGAAALWLTHSRGALLALLVVALLLAIALGWRFLRTHRALAAAGLAAVALAAYGVYATGLWNAAFGKESGTAAQRLVYWRTTWRMIAGHPWLGVGPGNFGPAYTRLMDENALEEVSDPHNFALETWATSGVFALVALAVTLAAFFVAVIRGLRSEGGTENGEWALRWEYYVGGMFGLLLGFVLRVSSSPPDEIMTQAWAAGLRSVVWFAAFGLLEGVPWTARGRALVLTAGVAALLLNLGVSGGIAFPSVAGPLWVAAALALASANDAPQSAIRNPQSAIGRVLPLPVFAGLALAYLVYVMEPVSRAAALREEAEASGRAILDQVNKNPGATFKDPLGLYRKAVIGPLDEAVKADPDDARNEAVRAYWYGELYRLELLAGVSARQARPDADKAADAARQAQRLAPDSFIGYAAEYQVRTLFARLSEIATRNTKDKGLATELEGQAREQYHLAGQALDRFLPTDPTNPILRYQIAEALHRAGDEAGARKFAAAALDLDGRLTRPTRRLTDPQRQELRQWAKEAPGG
jgi:hypothetical protein